MIEVTSHITLGLPSKFVEVRFSIYFLFYGSRFSFYYSSFDKVLFFNVSTCTTFLLFVFYLKHAVLIMYLVILKFLVCSIILFCNAPCNAVNSGYILKGIETFSSCFVNKYMLLLIRYFQYSSSFVSGVLTLLFLSHCEASACVYL